jgi:hypothetical protein
MRRLAVGHFGVTFITLPPSVQYALASSTARRVGVGAHDARRSTARLRQPHAAERAEIDIRVALPPQSSNEHAQKPIAQQANREDDVECPVWFKARCCRNQSSEASRSRGDAYGTSDARGGSPASEPSTPHSMPSSFVPQRRLLLSDRHGRRRHGAAPHPATSRVPKPKPLLLPNPPANPNQWRAGAAAKKARASSCCPPSTITAGAPVHLWPPTRTNRGCEFMQPTARPSQLAARAAWPLLPLHSGPSPSKTAVGTLVNESKDALDCGLDAEPSSLSCNKCRVPPCSSFTSI